MRYKVDVSCFSRRFVLKYGKDGSRISWERWRGTGDCKQIQRSGLACVLHKWGYGESAERR